MMAFLTLSLVNTFPEIQINSHLSKGHIFKSADLVFIVKFCKIFVLELSAALMPAPHLVWCCNNRRKIALFDYSTTNTFLIVCIIVSHYSDRNSSRFFFRWVKIYNWKLSPLSHSYLRKVLISESPFNEIFLQILQHFHPKSFLFIFKTETICQLVLLKSDIYTFLYRTEFPKHFRNNVTSNTVFSKLKSLEYWNCYTHTPFLASPRGGVY